MLNQVLRPRVRLWSNQTDQDDDSKANRNAKQAYRERDDVPPKTDGPGNAESGKQPGLVYQHIARNIAEARHHAQRRAYAAGALPEND